MASGIPIEITGLTKQFGAVTAVDDLTFTVEPGKVTGFLGPNGAGKTTTLRVLLGLVRPTRGTATFGGTPYASLTRPFESVGAALEATFHPGRTRSITDQTCIASSSDSRISRVVSGTAPR